MKVARIETFALNLPFVTRVAHHMQRASTHGERLYVCRLTTDTGIVGYGEGQSSDAQIARVVGRTPFDFLMDDTVGPGIQMALYDAIGKAEKVPVYRLLGPKVRDRCPISWWAIDMPPEDWAAEAAEAVRLGYTSFKLKARPWRDIFEQVEAVSKVVPPNFKLDVDFNSFLLNAGNAIPILRELERQNNVSIFETPIPQTDVEGYKQIRNRINRPISIHFGQPPIMTALREEVCDGFVIGGNAESVLRQATLAAEANKPFWLQMVGTGITTAFALHLGAVLSHAQWPAITCHELWENDLLKTRLEVQDGYLHVPETPGLGVEIDEEAIDRYRVEEDEPTPKEEYLKQRRVLRIRWPDGRTWCYTSEAAYQQAFSAGSMPLFERGVTLEVIEDDK